jgi:pilus assembly protein Flp/PilA
MSSIRTTIAGLLSARRPGLNEGQGLAEYALILALIAIVAIVALIFLGGQVSKILSTVSNSI